MQQRRALEVLVGVCSLARTLGRRGTTPRSGTVGMVSSSREGQVTQRFRSRSLRGEGDRRSVPGELNLDCEPVPTARLRAIRWIIARPGSRSPYPFASVTSHRTTRPRRFSINTRPRWLSLDSGHPFAIQTSIRVRSRFVGVVLSFLAAEVDVRIAALGPLPLVTTLGLEALLARPSLDQSAVDAEVLVRRQSLGRRLVDVPPPQALGDLAIQQPVPVLGERARSQTASSMLSPTNQRNSRL